MTQGRVATLPVDTVLPDLLRLLAATSSAVLMAPPGAGKTTRVAPALLNEPWCAGDVLLLSPRRLAARAAAERIAAEREEAPGATIGYATRLDSRRSAATRLTVMTHGVFLARIQTDPELAGVSAVLFDEVHERSLDGDFALALALDAQSALRPDLRLIAMSATLDAARVSALLGDAPLIESEGRAHPLALHHVGRDPTQRIEDAVAAAIRRALAEEAGGLLAFLPGVAEIERVAERLDALPAAIMLHRLHGAIDPGAQRAAIAPAAPGVRKLVLATAIAETSLTLDGVRIVVDSGLARRPRYDRAAGVTRLVTERVSQAAATQRAGRAGRQGPGVAYRLWEAAATAGLPPHDPPELLEADLSGLLLDCAIWGEADPRRLRWLDPPGEAALAEARARLATIAALDDDGRPTDHGRRIARLPLPPRLGHMLVRAAELGWGATAARIAVLLGERGLGGGDVDIERRLARWRGERGQRAEAARGLARRWARLVGAGEGVDDAEAIAGSVALAFPDRVAKRRDADGVNWASVGGRGYRLDPASGLAGADWLAVAESAGQAAGARILSAAALPPELVETLSGDRIETRRTVEFDAASGVARALRDRRLGAIRLSSGPDPDADPAAIAAALLDGVRGHGLAMLPWSPAARALRSRAAYAAGEGSSELSDARLIARLDDWLPPLLAGVRRLGDIAPDALAAALDGLLDWGARRTIERVAPAYFTSPAGSRHAIDYAAEGGPRVELRVQALFGLGTHPTVGDVPLVLSLTSPAGRPIQTTRDLPGFWAGSWRDVAREMRGRYPRHPWPDDPAAAPPTLRTKRRDARLST